MKIEVYSDTDAVTKKAAALVAVEARAAVAARGDFVMAASGGHTAWQMLLALAGEDVPRDTVHVVQVDEKVAPSGHPDGNLTHLRESLLEHALLRPERIHAMPAESSNLQATCEEYALTLQAIPGSTPVLDLIHLGLGPVGLGPDGLTALLVSGDAVLEIK